MGKLKEWFHEQKDNSVSMLAEKALQSRLERYGQVLSFQMDSRQRCARLELLLHGEANPVVITVGRYELIWASPEAFVVVRQASASREWMNSLLGDFVIGKRLPIPEKYSGLAKMLL